MVDVINGGRVLEEWELSAPAKILGEDLVEIPPFQKMNGADWNFEKFWKYSRFDGWIMPTIIVYSFGVYIYCINF